jgi:hypothetical protein
MPNDIIMIFFRPIVLIYFVHDPQLGLALSILRLGLITIT